MNTIFATPDFFTANQGSEFFSLKSIKRILPSKPSLQRKGFAAQILSNTLVIQSSKSTYITIEIRNLLGDLVDEYQLSNTVFTQINLAKYDLIVCDITIKENYKVKKNFKHIVL